MDHSDDEKEEAIPIAWIDLTFDDVQSLFHSRMSRLPWVIENGEESVFE
jgi:hypothetical protein